VGAISLAAHFNRAIELGVDLSVVGLCGPNARTLLLRGPYKWPCQLPC
jgi:hypothetical protein